MAENRPATLRQIADHVGVGTSAAAVVLNGAKSGTKVSEKTRNAILKAAKELNYRPNALAQSLRKRRTGIVGFYSGYDYIDPRNQYIAELMSGLQEGCSRNGLNLLLHTPRSEHTARDIVNDLSDGRLDGLVITARPDHPINALLAGSHLPVVAIADRISDLPSIFVDSAQGGILQARHLAERGHRNVLYVPSDYPFPSVLERQISFHEEARKLGMEVIDASPISGHLDAEKLPKEKTLLNPNDLSLLQGSNPVTAVQCWDDTPAYRIASQLAELGLRIPDDISVVGYNGCLPSIEPRWRLSTVRAPWPEVGRQAIQVLHAFIEGQTFLHETVLPVEFVVGSTS